MAFANNDGKVGNGDRLVLHSVWAQTMASTKGRFGWIYFGTIVATIAFMLLNPLWCGRSYNQYDDGWYDGGTFALAGADGQTKRAPVWSPPKPHAWQIVAPIRWPFQIPNSHHHVEWAIAKMAIQLSAIVMVLGMIPAIIGWRLRRQWDSIRRIAHSTSIWLLIAFCVLGGLFIFSSGYAMTDFNILLTLGIGWAVGVTVPLVGR